MASIKLRIAEIKGKGIKKRCRKEDFIYIQAVGVDNTEAIEKLSEKIKTESEKYKDWTLNKKGQIYDCEKCERGFLSFSIFATVEADNLIDFDYVEQV